MAMTSEEMQAFLAKPNNAIIGVNRAEGGPQLTPVWFAWDGEKFLFTTTRERVKYINIKRDPSISLIVDDLTAHKYVTAYGRAEIIEQNIGEFVRPIVTKYVPAEQVEQWVQRTDSDPSRVIIVLHPEKVLTS